MSSVDPGARHGAAGLVFPLILATVVKPGIQKGMDMLKANLEQGTA